MGGIIGGIVSGVGSIAGASIEASAAKKASKQQAKSAQASLDLQRDIFETTAENQAPFIEGGTLALEALLFELGLGEAPTFGGTPEFTVGDRTFGTREEAEAFLAQAQQPSFKTTFTQRPDERGGGFLERRTLVPAQGEGLQVVDTSTGGQTFGGFETSPGFQFAREQGVATIDASAAAQGGLFSGATGEALSRFGTGLAQQEHGTFLGRLANLVGAGQNSVGQLAQSGAVFGQGAASALAGLGNAQSAGTIGQANAITGGLNSLATAFGAFNPFGGGSAAPQFSPIPVSKPSLVF